MRKTLIATALAAGLSAVMTTTALADCREQATAAEPSSVDEAKGPTDRDATEIVQKMVEEAEPADNPGEPTHVENGPAKPRENWFGCNPSSDSEHCEESEEARSDAEKRDTQVAAMAEQAKESESPSNAPAQDDAKCGGETTG